jgi:hypothetical protein
LKNIGLLLNEGITAIDKHISKQLLYQKEVDSILESNKKMKAAEREVNRVIYTFDMLRNENFPMDETNS